ncbi:MAG: hypothetical protein ABR970_15100 [Roseiarcus sp.]|jgi:hypothetical protein
MGKSRARRRAPRTVTERAACAIACCAHLRDLRKAHGAAPPDVAVPSRSLPDRVEPTPVASYCGSPAAMCAELGE